MPLSQKVIQRVGRHPIRVALLAPIVVLVAGAASWPARGVVLSGAAKLLVAEDPLAPVDMIVVSNAAPTADAFEAVRLYRNGVSPRILLATWASEPEPFHGEIRRLGIPHLETTELVVAILQRSGVPPDAITVLPAAVDGTRTEIAAVAAFAQQHMPEGLLYVTARSHTARARWLLRRQLPRQTTVIVHSPGTDSFSVDSWWHNRASSRELVTEYVRWLVTLVFPNRLHRTS